MFPQGKPWATHFLLKVAAAVSVFLIFLVLFLPNDATTRISNSIPGVDMGRHTGGVIPNQVHFVYIIPSSKDDFSFQFSHFLSIYAAWHYWRPQSIFLHTNVDAAGPEVARAREGTAGKWNQHIFNLFDLTINTVPIPTHADNGKKLAEMEHKSDFVRVKAVHDLGGIYIDWDVHALRDIAPLRESGFRAIAGRQSGGEVNSGTFMSAREAKMMKLWMKEMHRVYTGDWTSHSNAVITRVGQRLVREPREMLILEQDAFAPGSWRDADTDVLFGVHNDTESNLKNYTPGMKLPAHEEEFRERWEHPDRFPKWERDWSSTYLLHAFTPDRSSHKVEGFEEITPRYVLERQSNFARAVYPVTKIMYDKGLIGVDDSHTGL
jgi:hypothetical protein